MAPERSKGEGQGEGLVDARDFYKAQREALQRRFGNRVVEYGSRGHALGHVKRIGYETASVPMPWDWPVK